MSQKVPNLEISSGHKIPQIGIGTGSIVDSASVDRTIITALKCGYRHIDTAFVYMNQRAIGNTLKYIFEEGEIKNVDMILEELGLDYLDLCLIHWPMSYKEGDDLFMNTPLAKIPMSDSADYLDTWRAMEKCVHRKKIRSIGLSNFNMEQIKRVIDNSKIKPSVLQIEFHPYLQQLALLDFCRKNDIQLVAYSPFCRNAFPDTRGQNKNFHNVFTDPIISEMAKKHGKSNGQLVLRFLMQQYGICVIPKSNNDKRIEENINIYDFKLIAQELEELKMLNREQRFWNIPGAYHSPHYPWKRSTEE